MSRYEKGQLKIDPCLFNYFYYICHKKSNMFGYNKQKIRNLESKIKDLENSLEDSYKINNLLKGRVKETEDVLDSEINSRVEDIIKDKELKSNDIIKKKNAEIQSLRDKLRNLENDYSKLFEDRIIKPNNQNRKRRVSFRRPKANTEKKK